MNLLFLAHRIPYPPDKGDKIRSWHELRALAERGHAVHLLAFVDDPADLRYRDELQRWCASVELIALNPMVARLGALRALATGQSLSVGYYASRTMRAAVQRVIARQQIDAVLAYSSTMAQYVPVALRAHALVDLVDVDSEKWRDYAQQTGDWRKPVYQLEAQRLRRYEEWIVRSFARTVVTTAREAALLDGVDEFTRRARLRTITNGVDLAYFHSEAAPDMPKLPRLRETNEGTPRLVFVGAMDYRANANGACWFADEVWPRIRAQQPKAEFIIVGSNPPAAVQALAARPGITVTGRVADVRPYLRAATLCVVPLRIARGVQNKILEAMAAGRAVVATPVAAAGLRADAPVCTATTPDEFAEAVLTLLNDPTARAELAEHGRAFVAAHHAWPPLLDELHAQIEAVALRPSRQSYTQDVRRKEGC